MNTFNLVVEYTTVNKKGVFKATTANAQLQTNQEQLNHEDEELKAYLASITNGKLKHPIFMVRVLQSEIAPHSQRTNKREKDMKNEIYSVEYDEYMITYEIEGDCDGPVVIIRTIASEYGTIDQVMFDKETIKDMQQTCLLEYLNR